MTYFAAVAAVRIQTWLARTPSLRFVRGASRVLSSTTRNHGDETTEDRPVSMPALKERAGFPSSVDVDQETAEVAGVCVLRSDSVEDLDEAVDRLLDYLQRQLPGVEWTAWRAAAPSYVNARQQVRGSDRETAGIKHWPHRLPLSLDLPFMQPCGRCSHEMATRAVRDPDDAANRLLIGPDCYARHDAGVDRQFDDFDQLVRQCARGVTRGRRDAANHLATICADGNRMGEFFDKVAELDNAELQTKLSNAVTCSIEQATKEAACCSPESQRHVAITHFAGGDDVFASVAANFAWQYVETLGRRFEEEFRKHVEDAFAGAGDEPAGHPKPDAESKPDADSPWAAVRTAAEDVSLGIGMAFAHYKHPIAACREAALAAEKHAKRNSRGEYSAVAWVDLTVESLGGAGGDRLPEDRLVDVNQLTKDLAAPDPVLTMPSSARNRLVALLRPRQEEKAAQIAEGVLAWAERVGRGDELPTDLRQDPDTAVKKLRLTADRARWWPIARDPEGSEPGEAAEESWPC